MPKQFAGAACVLCPTGKSSRTGEHVWPSWLLGMWPESDGPFTLHKGGEPILNRDGGPSTQSTLSRVKLPVCACCNGILNHRFEAEAKEPVQRLVTTNGETRLSATETSTVGEWLLKTSLFLSHPSAAYLHPHFGGNLWLGTNEDLYSWTLTGEPPPTGLSLWASKTRAASEDDPEPQRVSLSTIVADGREVEFRAFQAGLVGISVTLVYHPGWPIDHPAEAGGAAVRMWPRPNPEPVDLTCRSRISSRDPIWLAGPRLTFGDGTYEPGRDPASLAVVELPW